MTDATSSLTFVGTATTVLRFGETTIMTDPNFLRRGQRAYLGWGLSSRRLTEPAVPDPLPKLDAVLLSHLHGDHWDRVAENTLPPRTPILTTDAARRTLVRRGFDAHGLRDWDERLIVDGATTVRVTAVPAVHARGLMGKLLPPVLGSIVDHRAADDSLITRVYISGDTVTGTHLDAVAKRFPDIDLAVLHLGGTRVLFHTVTMDDKQGVDFVRRVSPRQVVPVHYDDYTVFRSPLSHFLARAGDVGLGGAVRTVERGQTIALPRRDKAGIG